MTKYIDADRLIRRLENRTYKAVPNFIKMINEQEAADVVEVVRCKDCKYIDAIYPFCTEWDIVVDTDGFCYMGEKE